MKLLPIAIAGPALFLAACGDSASDVAEDRMERAAEQSAADAGPAEAALGLSEAQLLDAELVGPNDVELGDVAGVVRGADGSVERLLVEIEDSNPDRFVHVPIDGLTVVTRGDDRDLATSMTAQELAALSDVKLPAR